MTSMFTNLNVYDNGKMKSMNGDKAVCQGRAATTGEKKQVIYKLDWTVPLALSVLVINNFKIGPSFIFPLQCIFICDQVIFATVTAIATATATRALAPSISSRILVLLLTIVGVGVSLRHDNISFVLYRYIC